MSDGKRRLVQVAEITGMESDVVQTQTIFEFKRSGTGPEGEVLGELRATGLRPKIIENLELLGFAATPDMFDPTQLR